LFGDKRVYSCPNTVSSSRLRIKDEQGYGFTSNQKYQEAWHFLSDKETRKVIAQQLTFLDFHEWLLANLEVDKGDPGKPFWRQLSFHIEEGFYKGDVLLYASICELGLHSIDR
jgi:hypothetical protein